MKQNRNQLLSLATHNCHLPMVLFAVPTVQALPQRMSVFRLFHLPLNRKFFIRHTTYIPSAGHQGYHKTLSCLKEEAAWNG